MLVRPRGIAAGAMDNSENRVGADKVPWINRIAIGVANQEVGIDRVNPAVPARRTAVQLSLIDIDPLVVFGSSARRGSSGRTIPARISVAGRLPGGLSDRS